MKKSILYLWYLYNRFNMNEPFTVSVRFSETVFAMVYLINDMKNLAKGFLPKDKPLLQIYLYGEEKSDEYWPSHLEVCNEAKFYSSLEELQKNVKKKAIYLYSEAPE